MRQNEDLSSWPMLSDEVNWFVATNCFALIFGEKLYTTYAVDVLVSSLFHYTQACWYFRYVKMSFYNKNIILLLSSISEVYPPKTFFQNPPWSSFSLNDRSHARIHFKLGIQKKTHTHLIMYIMHCFQEKIKIYGLANTQISSLFKSRL